MVRKSTSRRPHIVHHLQHLVPLFAETDHDPRLGEHRRIKFLHSLQQTQEWK